jgi:glutamyl-tRNA synthetase
MAPNVTRLAPSPTGHLHLGHAWSFLCTWALARAGGWTIRLRLEDLDRSRASSDACDDALWCLRWLGIDWDGQPELQSNHAQRHADAMRALAARGLVFEAHQTRAQVRAAAPNESNAPNEGDAVLRFPPDLRPPMGPAWGFRDPACNHRFACPAGSRTIHDRIQGERALDPSLVWGDPLVWMKAGVPSYQLAVVVDDLAAGVTDVVRGMDLLDSAVLQGVLIEALGAAPPRWWHLPLVTDEHDRRLAKRHDALSLRALAALGATPGRIRALMLHWCAGRPLTGEASTEDLTDGLTEHGLVTMASTKARLAVTPDIVRWLCHGP